MTAPPRARASRSDGVARAQPRKRSRLLNHPTRGVKWRYKENVNAHVTPGKRLIGMVIA
jgi:hypothetical protein